MFDVINDDVLIASKTNFDAAIEIAEKEEGQLILIQGQRSGTPRCSIMKQVDGTKVMTICHPNATVELRINNKIVFSGT